MTLRLPTLMLGNFRRLAVPSFCRQINTLSGQDFPVKEMTLEVESVLVTGAAEGLGLEFVRQLARLPTPPQYIFAADINQRNLEIVKRVDFNPDRTEIVPLKLDVTIRRDREEVRKAVEELVGDMGLSLLVNTAGMAHIHQLRDLFGVFMEEHFRINCVGPVMLVMEMFPVLYQAAEYKSGVLPYMSASKAAVLHISPWSPFINDDDPMLFYEEEIAYRTSKVALHMAMRCLALNLTNLGVLALQMNPGNVKTTVGQYQIPSLRLQNPLEVSHSVSDMLKTLAQCGKSHQGAFLERNGDFIPF
ncbi:c-factor [Trichonephila inaurata madagascariensis]|uniref:C-factor n=1 Tax=Trichonephila inaurata madagascariensis TaxID=2747483 RepID=A0A8X6XD67_9ARAC|nr:c-factor [Trichonephila inaurata madagascariensis]